MVEIVYTKWGLANRFSNPEVIELNQSLKEHPKLLNKIIQHELEHKEDNTFRQDLSHDLTPIGKVKQRELIFFMFKHPRTLTQFLPFYWSPRRKEIIYDLNMLLIYGAVIGTIGILLYIF